MFKFILNWTNSILWNWNKEINPGWKKVCAVHVLSNDDQRACDLM